MKFCKETDFKDLKAGDTVRVVNIPTILHNTNRTVLENDNGLLFIAVDPDRYNRNPADMVANAIVPLGRVGKPNIGLSSLFEPIFSQT